MDQFSQHQADISTEIAFSRGSKYSGKVGKMAALQSPEAVSACFTSNRCCLPAFLSSVITWTDCQTPDCKLDLDTVYGLQQQLPLSTVDEDIDSITLTTLKYLCINHGDHIFFNLQIIKSDELMSKSSSCAMLFNVKPALWQSMLSYLV